MIKQTGNVLRYLYDKYKEGIIINNYVILGSCPYSNHGIMVVKCDPKEGLKIGEIVGWKRDKIQLNVCPVITSHCNVEIDHNFAGVVQAYTEGSEYITVVYTGYVYARIPIATQDLTNAKVGSYLNLTAKSGVQSSNLYNVYVLSRHENVHYEELPDGTLKRIIESCFLVYLR